VRCADAVQVGTDHSSPKGEGVDPVGGTRASRAHGDVSPHLGPHLGRTPRPGAVRCPQRTGSTSYEPLNNVSLRGPLHAMMPRLHGCMRRLPVTLQSRKYYPTLQPTRRAKFPTQQQNRYGTLPRDIRSPAAVLRQLVPTWILGSTFVVPCSMQSIVRLRTLVGESPCPSTM
jgi:hypothetical protein